MPTSTPNLDDPSVSCNEDGLVNMAEILAHRIRGLVAGIEGFTDLLADTLLTQDQRDLALRILEGAARIERVLADLQLYGQPIDPVMLPLRARDVTDELLVALAEEDRQRISIDRKKDGEQMVMGDPYLLRQALLVLVKNALEATDDSVWIDVEETDGQTLQFNVWNEGTISLDQPERQVFQPFFTTKAQNLGVGLPIARRIGEAHGGSVFLATGTSEEGTCFTLQLPLASQDQIEDQPS